MNVWKGCGYGSVMYLSVLTGIDRELYEAADLDGATTFQRIWYITVPMLIPMATLLVLMSLGGIMRSDTGLFYQVTKNLSSLRSTTRVLDSYVLNALRQSTDYGMTSAITLYQSVIGTIMVVGTNLIIRKVSPENSLF